MLSQRYKPTDVSGIIGNKKNIDAIQQWISNWTPENKKKCLLISGNSGIDFFLSKANKPSCSSFFFNSSYCFFNAPSPTSSIESA